MLVTTGLCFLFLCFLTTQQNLCFLFPAAVQSIALGISGQLNHNGVADTFSGDEDYPGREREEHLEEYVSCIGRDGIRWVRR